MDSSRRFYLEKFVETVPTINWLGFFCFFFCLLNKFLQIKQLPLAFPPFLSKIRKKSSQMKKDPKGAGEF